jgi:gliding motility-associated-like protein
MKKRITLFRIALLATSLSLPFHGLSQILLNPNQPEQDACNAISLCGGQFFTPYSYQGQGLVSDMPTTPCGSGEDNSMWMKISIATAGTMSFKIIPKDTADDYDFAVIDATGADCSRLSPSLVVRCNFNNNELGSNPGGITGLSDTATQTSVQGGRYNWSYVKSINVQPGQTYLIMINNFGHDDNPGPSSGFTIDFTTSTATFVNNVPPTLKDIIKKCSDDSVIVRLTKPVQCSTIAPDGSNFNIPGVTVVSAGGLNCINGNGYASEIVIRFAGHAPPGNYTVNVQYGSNGLTLLDVCNKPIPLPSSLPFTVPSPVVDDFLMPLDTTKCNYSTIPLKADRDFDKYQWNTGQTTSSIAVIDPGTYTLQVTDSNGCVGSESVTIKDSTCPQYVFLPSAFTPNNDGHNDLFRPKFAGAASIYKFAVYDRWGRRVFETNDPGTGWDGTTGGVEQPMGMYVWVCVYKLYEMPERMQRGTVMLVR